MPDKKPLFKPPYDLKDVSLLFTIIALVLIIAAVLGNNLFGLFQDSVNFGQAIDIGKLCMNNYLVFNYLVKSYS